MVIQRIALHTPLSCFLATRCGALAQFFNQSTQKLFNSRIRYICCMKVKKDILGIIPARGGSKAIPRKNIKPFCGKPLLAWAIETLKKSGIVDRVIVSTDEEEIAAVARMYGAEVPFMRPAELAEDNTPTLPVLVHALSWLKERENYVPEYVVLFEPTSAARRPYHVREIVEKLRATGADSVISVAEVPGVLNPMWQVTMAAHDRLSIFAGGPLKNFVPRRQSLPKTYYRNSSVYAFQSSLLFSPEPNIYGDDSRGCVVDKKFAFDIDEPSDWEAAEEKFKKILEEEKP